MSKQSHAAKSHAAKIHNVNINVQKVMLTPQQLKQVLPIDKDAIEFIDQSRNTIANILDGKDKRKLAIVGPCSIHDLNSAREYALKLKDLHTTLSEELFVVMRVYFEKPRTTVGWKGLINDPHLNNSFEVEQGLKMARELLLELAKLKLPVASEVLDPICPQYLSDLISWAAIGARTSESQTHREMASGLSMPVGFKNGTDGSASIAINAMKAAASGHSFIGINQLGQVTLMKTRGNPHGHVILRGGNQPNYQAEHVASYEEKLEAAGLSRRVMIDCSHANSNKDYRLQPRVLSDVTRQIVDGNQSIIGFMLESHLYAGNQKIGSNENSLTYGVSITDGCIDWETTEACLTKCARALSAGSHKTG